jgi:hypothetical protein
VLLLRCSGATPNDGGRSRHAHPLVSTYAIALIHRARAARPYHHPADAAQTVESTATGTHNCFGIMGSDNDQPR